jgi:hypothetical protein
VLWSLVGEITNALVLCTPDDMQALTVLDQEELGVDLEHGHQQHGHSLAANEDALATPKLSQPEASSGALLQRPRCGPVAVSVAVPVPVCV